MKIPNDKFIITCALTGAGHDKTKNPNLPMSPAEIITQAQEVEKAGASIVHLHARAKDGKPTAKISVFKEIMDGVRETTNLIINLTTGGSQVLSRQERMAVVPELKPDMASFSVGSTMTGRYSKEQGAWVQDFTLAQSYADLEATAKLFKENGVRPELEIYDVGMLRNVKTLSEMGLLVEPWFINFVTGIPGQIIQGDIKTLLFLSELLPADTIWQATGIGGSTHFKVAAGALLLDGNVRVGLEDNIYIERGVLADSNAQLVEKVVYLGKNLGKTPTTPDEARKYLEL